MPTVPVIVQLDTVVVWVLNEIVCATVLVDAIVLNVLFCAIIVVDELVVPPIVKLL